VLSVQQNKTIQHLAKGVLRLAAKSLCIKLKEAALCGFGSIDGQGASEET